MENLETILNSLQEKGSSLDELKKLKNMIEPRIGNNRSLDSIMKELIGEIIQETKNFVESKNKHGISYVSGFSSGIYLPTFDGSGEINLLLTGGVGSRSNDNLVINSCTIFDVASVTKIFTLILTLKLSEEGIINLDDKIADLNPDFKGLEDFTFNDLIRMHGILYTEGNIASAHNEKEAFNILKTIYLKNNTRTSNNYTDFGAIVIGKTIEKVISEREGKKITLNDLMNEYIYKKAGMTNTTFNPTSYNISGNGRDDRLVHDPKARLLGGMVGSAGIFTTSSDLNKLAKSLCSVNYANRGLISKLNLKKLGEVTFPDAKISQKGNLGVYVKNPLGYAKTFTPSVFSTDSFSHQGWTGAIALFDPNNNIHFNFLPNAIFKSDNSELVKNDKPVGYGSCFDTYEEAIVNNIMIMLIVKKYYNMYKSQDITIDEHISLNR